MHVLITAGATREPIDAVRFISNRSSGAMGVALAQAACDAGHTVTLLLGHGPAEPEARAGLRVVRFTSTADLSERLAEHFPGCDVLVMAAAVSDYRPASATTGKRPRSADPAERWTLTLEPTPDLLAQVAGGKRPGQKVVAFALEEPAQLEARAAEKLARKGADAVVANPLGTMESDEIEATWLTASGEREGLARMTKPAFAGWLISRLEGW